MGSHVCSSRRVTTAADVSRVRLRVLPKPETKMRNMNTAYKYVDSAQGSFSCGFRQQRHDWPMTIFSGFLAENPALTTTGGGRRAADQPGTDGSAAHTPPPTWRLEAPATRAATTPQTPLKMLKISFAAPTGRLYAVHFIGILLHAV